MEKGGVVMDIEQMYQEYAELIYHYLLGLCHNSALAEDLVQTTFLKAIESVDSFRHQSKVSTWLFQIAKHEYIDTLRKKENQNISIESFCPDDLQGEMKTAQEKPSVLDYLIEKEQKERILWHLHQLPDPYKEVFLLHIYGECSYREIALVFGKTEVWARVTCFRAKEKLIERLKQEMDSDE